MRDAGGLDYSISPVPNRSQGKLRAARRNKRFLWNLVRDYAGQAVNLGLNCNHSQPLIETRKNEQVERRIDPIHIFPLAKQVDAIIEIQVAHSLPYRFLARPITN